MRDCGKIEEAFDFFSFQVSHFMLKDASPVAEFEEALDTVHNLKSSMQTVLIVECKCV